MKFDIARPLEHVVEKRRRALKLALLCSPMIVTGMAMWVFGVMGSAEQERSFGNGGIAIFVVSGFAFSYFMTKFRNLKPLDFQQEKRLLSLCLKYPEVARYQRLVTAAGRQLVVTELEELEQYTDNGSRNI